MFFEDFNAHFLRFCQLLAGVLGVCKTAAEFAVEQRVN